MKLEEKRLYEAVIVGFGIIIIILLLVIYSITYKVSVEKCVNAGHNINYCKEGLK